MIAKRMAIKLYTMLRELCTAQRGNVVIPFALALLPIMGGVGAAVDYSRANSDKTAMQSALDATAFCIKERRDNDAGANQPAGDQLFQFIIHPYRHDKRRHHPNVHVG